MKKLIAIALITILATIAYTETPDDMINKALAEYKAKHEKPNIQLRHDRFFVEYCEKMKAERLKHEIKIAIVAMKQIGLSDIEIKEKFASYLPRFNNSSKYTLKNKNTIVASQGYKSFVIEMEQTQANALAKKQRMASIHKNRKL